MRTMGLYHGLRRVRRRIEARMCQLEQCRGSCDPEVQQLLRVTCFLRKAELESAGAGPRPVVPPLKRSETYQ